MLQVCQAVHEPAVAVRQLLDMLAAGVAAGPGGVAGLFKLLVGEGVRMCFDGVCSGYCQMIRGFAFGSSRAAAVRIVTFCLSVLRSGSPVSFAETEGHISLPHSIVALTGPEWTHWHRDLSCEPCSGLAEAGHRPAGGAREPSQDQIALPNFTL